jgi:hypothetical protein
LKAHCVPVTATNADICTEQYLPRNTFAQKDICPETHLLRTIFA